MFARRLFPSGTMEDELHDLIHTNLCLLKDKGHKLDFEKGMFRTRNLPGFEKVGYGLLLIIDSAECKKSIPWPLINDKTLRNEFRQGFSKFIKMINSKYPEANIPELMASHFQYPGGLAFLRFMYKLSAFTRELELNRMLSPEEKKQVLPRFKPSKTDRDNRLKIKIVKSACNAAEIDQQQYMEYQAAALPQLQKLDAYNDRLSHSIKSVQAKLESEVAGLKMDEQTKLRILDVEDSEVMKDWNLATEAKFKELKSSCEKLVQYRDVTRRCRQKLQASTTGIGDTLCLDGSKLSIKPIVAELAGSPVYNSQGEVKLATLLKAGLAVARRLNHTTPAQTPLVPTARELLKESLTLQEKATRLMATLDDMHLASKKSIEKFLPIVKEQLKETKVPDHFKYLRKRPPLEFVKPSSVPKSTSPYQSEKKGTRLANILKYSGGVSKVEGPKLRRRSNSFSCLETPVFRRPWAPAACSTTSRKPQTKSSLRRSISHEDLTLRALVTPDNSCRRSLYRNLPTGAKPVPTRELPVIRQSLLPRKPMVIQTPPTLPDIGSNELSSASEQTASLDQEAVISDNSSDPAPSVPLNKRKSLIDLVDRYKRIKQKMATQSREPN